MGAAVGGGGGWEREGGRLILPGMPLNLIKPDTQICRSLKMQNSLFQSVPTIICVSGLSVNPRNTEHPSFTSFSPLYSKFMLKICSSGSRGQ